jgi:hypothetical protein
MRGRRLIVACSVVLAACSSTQDDAATDGGMPLDAKAGSDGASRDGRTDASGRDGTTTGHIDAGKDVDASVDGPHDGARPADSGAFVHPGVLVDTAQLDFVKAKLVANAQPWTAALTPTTTASGNGQKYDSLTYVPHPVATMDCTADATGCASMLSDAIAAYTDALTYYYSTAQNRGAYAAMAITIMNAWSSKLTASNGSQAQLEEAWAAEMFPRAAEIIRYAYAPAAGDATLDVTAFSTMLLHVMKPELEHGAPSENGNWELSMADGLIDIGVFTEDLPTFQAGIALWKGRVPAYIYLTTDNGGSGVPNAPPGGDYTSSAELKCYWLSSGSPTTSCTVPAGFEYVNGMVQETCRDMGHVALGLNSLVYAAETARIQGVDLYGEEQDRLTAAYEFSTAFDTGYLTSHSWPSQPCGGQPGKYGQSGGNNEDGTGGVGYELGWEVAYTEYADRLGVAMPNTLSFLTTYVRPASYKAGNQVAWETLTSAGTP